MKLHLISVGKPTLAYARAGWEEYVKRLGRYYQVRVTHVPDKRAFSEVAFRTAVGNATTVALVIDGGERYDSAGLAAFLRRRETDCKELCFMIGGPEGLPASTIASATYRWSLGPLTFPHDLAMLIEAEALYRAASINAGHPYHRA